MGHIQSCKRWFWVPTDGMSLRIRTLLSKTWMRIVPLLTRIIGGEHIVTDVEIVITLNDAMPMMIIGENEDIHLRGTMIVPPTLWTQAAQVDHVDPLSLTDEDHHVIVTVEDHIVHLVIDT
jgi:hypothetical protein